jgi:phosphatidylglycerol:prolipoprotein diacylglycerol transferase
MRQVLFEVPGLHLKVFGYGLMLFFAFVAALQLASWRARREKLDPENIYDLAVWVILGGLVGARLFFVAQYWGTRVHTFADIFKIWEGGIVLYGSILGATVAFFAVWARRRFPLRPMMDVMAPAMALGIAIGRLGCFLNGCCYGDQCDLPWAVSFPGPGVGVPGNAELPRPGSPPWSEQVAEGDLPATAAWSHPVHPTQIYSSIDGFILLGLLSAYYPIRRRDGEVFALLMVTYPITRFLIERLRNDETGMVAGMTISQSLSVVFFAGGVLYWLALSRWPAVRHADTAETRVPDGTVA